MSFPAESRGRLENSIKRVRAGGGKPSDHARARVPLLQLVEELTHRFAFRYLWISFLSS